MKQIFAIFLLVMSCVAQAEEYQLIVPFPPGNQTDNVARLLQDAVQRNTTDRIVILNMPGAETQIGAQHFKNNPKIDMIVGSGSQSIWNPLIRSNLGYTDSDFDHAIFVATTCGVWVVRSDSPLKDSLDLLRNMPPLVGGYSHSYNYNVNALVKERGVTAEIVPYKGTNDILVDIVNGNLPMGVVAMNSTLVQMVQAGKLRIIGNTYTEDITVGGIAIPSASRRLGVTGFHGFLSIDLRPGMDPARAQRLRKIMWQAVQDPKVKQGLHDLYLLPDATNNPKKIANFYSSYKVKAQQFLSK